ncbi:type-1 angiotensin II receptor-associated protein-like [Rhynchophorus ferrugineus]|uniref:type-1 angiotensin II receptor-associated protein-like n=1 Tax=Rhynchophorus ferrugineus TaxID=354439 RepID=UPI003FCDF722
MPLEIQIPNFNLKIVFLIHFIFTSSSCMGSWTSNAYLFYNSALIFFLCWSILNPQCQESLQLAIVINGVSFILDIILLIMNFPPSYSGAADKFAAATVILHLIVRPVLIYSQIKILEERGGNRGNISSIFRDNRTDSYEDIDRTTPPQASSAQSGYTFATAQPI